MEANKNAFYLVSVLGGQRCDKNSIPPAAAQMDISLFSTCLAVQLCTLISRLHRRVFPLFHKEKICHNFCENKLNWLKGNIKKDF